MKDKNNEIVGKCKHCGDPIYKFQVEAHRGCVKEFEFNPDYLDFDKGVTAGKQIVVTWITSHSQVEKCDPDVMAYFCDYRWIDEADWQTKVRDWGNEVESDINL